jgi:hypothetical protein
MKGRRDAEEPRSPGAEVRKTSAPPLPCSSAPPPLRPSAPPLLRTSAPLHLRSSSPLLSLTRRIVRRVIQTDNVASTAESAGRHGWACSTTLVVHHRGE